MTEHPSIEACEALVTRHRNRVHISRAEMADAIGGLLQEMRAMREEIEDLKQQALKQVIAQADPIVECERRGVSFFVSTAEPGCWHAVGGGCVLVSALEGIADKRSVAALAIARLNAIPITPEIQPQMELAEP